MSIERRQFSRVVYAMPALLQTADRQTHVKVIDLSLKGALIDVQGDAPPPVGSACELSLRLAGAGPDERITMVADVAHVQGSRLGLVCSSIDLDSMTHLKRLVALNLGDPQLLDRELKALTQG